MQSKYDTIISDLKESISKYKQALEELGFNVIIFTPQKVSPAKSLIEEYGLAIAAFIAFINAIIFLLYIPIDFILGKLGKQNLSERIINALTLPPLKKKMEYSRSKSLEDIKMFAESLEGKDGKKVAVVLLKRE